MTTTQRLRYLTDLINQLIGRTKTIGELDEVGEEDPVENLFAAIQIQETNETKKINLKTFFGQEIGEVPNHSQSYSTIDGIGDYKEIIINDTNSNPWRVKRVITDETNDSFKQNDVIYGFEDAAQTVYFEGIILSETAVIPADLSDSTKFLITNKKIKYE